MTTYLDSFDWSGVLSVNLFATLQCTQCDSLSGLGVSLIMETLEVVY